MRCGKLSGKVNWIERPLLALAILSVLAMAAPLALQDTEKEQSGRKRGDRGKNQGHQLFQYRVAESPGNCTDQVHQLVFLR